MERLPAPELPPSPASLPLPDIPLAALPSLLPPLPEPVDTISVPTKPDFRAPQTPLPDLDELALEAVRKLATERQVYARLYLADADTTDQASQRRRRAEQVVERAIRAMGGRPALLALKEMRARIWIEAWEHVLPPMPKRPPIVSNVGTYLYPVATWHFKGWHTFVNRRVQVKFSFDPKVPNENYTSYNPAITLDRYLRLFEHRWLFFAEQPRLLPLQGEATRWHFIDRFLGEGVVLYYLGEEIFQDQPVDVIRVDDRRYGHFLEAFFSRSTGLLVATREGLFPTEQQRYLQQYQMPPPTWNTLHTKYRTVQGVLVPHRLTRSGPSCPQCGGVMRRSNRTIEVTIQLKIAYNGQELESSAPNLEH
jgi:hypothetical protein